MFSAALNALNKYVVGSVAGAVSTLLTDGIAGSGDISDSSSSDD